LPIHHFGSSSLSSSNATFLLNNVLHVPQIQKNLLSISKFTANNNVYFEFHPSYFCVKDPMLGTTLHGKHSQGLYSLSHPQSSSSPSAFMGIRISLNGWHSWLGHPSLRIVHQVVS
jgi:hypothetical protein